MTGIRKYSRIPFVAEALIETGTERIQARILDISLKGALIALEGEASPPPPSPIRSAFGWPRPIPRSAWRP